jgi:Bacterial PH domain
MPFGLGRNDDDSSLQPLDSDDQNEIKKISEMLNPNEEVLVVARQSRVRPGGSAVTTNIIYVTNKRIIIRDPYMLGIKENIVDIPYGVITSVKLDKGLLSSTIRFEAPALLGSKRLGMIDGIVNEENDHEGIIEAIPKRKAEDVIQVIRSGMHDFSRNQGEIKTTSSSSPPQPLNNSYRLSIADELTKLGKLMEQGKITEEEFAKIKKDLLHRKTTG